MYTSNHIRSEEKKQRLAFIEEIGEGTIIHTVVSYDKKRDGVYIYDISDTGVMTIRPTDNRGLVITKFVARPNRILKYWKNAPQELLDKINNYPKEKWL